MKTFTLLKFAIAGEQSFVIISVVLVRAATVHPLRSSTIVGNQPSMYFSGIDDWRQLTCRESWLLLQDGTDHLVPCLSLFLLLAVVGHGHRDLLLENVIYTNTWAALNLLLRPLLMLLPHVHDCCGRRAIELLTVHAFEVLSDLAGHTPNLTDTATQLIFPDLVLMVYAILFGAGIQTLFQWLLTVSQRIMLLNYDIWNRWSFLINNALRLQHNCCGLRQRSCYLNSLYCLHVDQWWELAV